MSDLAPRLCIVTPSYNTGRYIGPCVRSVLDQDYPHVDYIVMDGGSTDGTVEVLKSFGPRLRWVSQKDKGQSDAINRGFAQTGEGKPDEVLGWLNSDDTYAPGAFRAAADYFAAHPEVDLLYGDATYTDTRGKHIAKCVHVEPFSRRRLFHYSDFIVQPTCFFRRRAFDAVGGVDASIHWAMDYDLWLRIVAAGFKAAYLRRVLANFRWLAENKTATGGWGRLDEIVRILARLGYGPPAYIQLEQCNMRARDALAALARGNLTDATESAAAVARTVFTSPRVVASLFDPHTWHIMWVGQVLRARAVAAQRREQAAPPRPDLPRHMGPGHPRRTLARL
jgi:glycosyltransferase involved in cell wall biosynthesis